MHVKMMLPLFLFFTLTPSFTEAGNVKKSYINLGQEGQQVQASDIPPNYGTIETTMKNIAYNALGSHGTYTSNIKKEEGKLGNSISLESGKSDFVTNLDSP